MANNYFSKAPMNMSMYNPPEYYMSPVQQPNIDAQRYLDELNKNAYALEQQRRLAEQYMSTPEQYMSVPKQMVTTPQKPIFVDYSKAIQPKAIKPTRTTTKANKQKVVSAPKETVSEVEQNQNARLDDILEGYRQIAKSREDVYQPYINYLEQKVGDIDNIIKQRNIDSHISAGLAGIANNPYIYSAYTSRNPLNDISNIANLRGDIANTQNKLLYDDSQARANVALSEALGLPAETALASPDFLKSAISARAEEGNTAYRKMMLDLEKQKMQEDIRQANISNALARDRIKLQEQELANAGLFKLLPSAISSLGYGVEPQAIIDMLNAYGYSPVNNVNFTPTNGGNLGPKTFD